MFSSWITSFSWVTRFHCLNIAENKTIKVYKIEHILILVKLIILGIWVYEECRKIVIVVSECEMIAYRPFWRHANVSS